MFREGSIMRPRCMKEGVRGRLYRRFLGSADLRLDRGKVWALAFTCSEVPVVSPFELVFELAFY